MKIFLSIVFLISIITSVVQSQPFGEIPCEHILKAKFNRAKIKVCGKVLDVELAESEIQRTFGLMCRETLSEDKGMLFIFPEERTLSFWMKNTKMPLSIGYFGKNKKLIDTYDMEPMNESKMYESSKPALYALETAQGWFKKNKITTNCKLEILKSEPAPVTKGQ